MSASSKRILYWISGPRLAWLNLFAAFACCAFLMSRRDWTFNRDAMTRLLDIIARVSFIYFLLAFVARPLNDVLHTRQTRWLMKNRRYFGLAFAAWFLQHLWILPNLGVWIFGVFWSRGTLIFPAVTLLLICLLAATSFNRAQRSLPGWKILHWIGMQAIWIWFLRIYVRFALSRAEIYQFVYIALAISAQLLRAYVYLKKRAKVRSGSSLTGLRAISVGVIVVAVLTLLTDVWVEALGNAGGLRDDYVQIVCVITVVIGLSMFLLPER
jgi:sulfoxide reductase heme-binding subunit YedZ